MTLLTTRPGEIGLLAADAIRSALIKATDQANISTYIEGASPLAWKSISDAGWDLVGIKEDDESATLRDLVEIAKVHSTVDRDDVADTRSVVDHSIQRSAAVRRHGGRRRWNRSYRYIH